MKNKKLSNLTFNKITIDDFKFISELRNDKENSQFFISNNTITLRSHKNFIKYLNNSDDICWIIKSNNNSIGIVSLYNVNLEAKVCEFGRFLIKKDCRRHGLGKFVLQWALNYARDNLGMKIIYLIVLKSNTLATKIYKTYGFKVKHENSTTLCMEKTLC